VATMQNENFKNMIDFDVTKDLFITQFGKWLGFFALIDGNCVPINAMAYVNEIPANPQTFKLIDGDYCILKNKPIQCNESDEKNNQSTNLDKPKYSHNSYVYIMFDHHIICQHPVLPTPEYLHVGTECDSTIMAPSLQYGVFYMRGNHCIVQSSNLSHFTQRTVFELNNSNSPLQPSSEHLNFKSLGDKPFSLEKYFVTLKNLEYDDTYGISGCLLVYGKTTNQEHSFIMMLNMDELDPLCDVLQQNPHLSKELMEKSKASKTFNMTVEVYQYLYGIEYVQLYAHKVSLKMLNLK